MKTSTLKFLHDWLYGMAFWQFGTASAAWRGVESSPQLYAALGLLAFGGALWMSAIVSRRR